MKQFKYANTPCCPIGEDYKGRFLCFNDYVVKHGYGSPSPDLTAPHWTLSLPELPAFIQSRCRLCCSAHYHYSPITSPALHLTLFKSVYMAVQNTLRVFFVFFFFFLFHVLLQGKKQKQNQNHQENPYSVTSR